MNSKSVLLCLLVISCKSPVGPNVSQNPIDHRPFRIVGVAWNDHIFSIMSDRSNYKILAGPSVNLDYPRFSPDGSKVLYEGYSNSVDLLLVDTAGTQTQVLASTEEPEWGASFFPDGSRIIFDRWNSLCVMNSDGSDQVTLTPRYIALNGIYSPATKRIYFTTNSPGNFEIYSMNSDGSDTTNLTLNSADDYEIALSPNGKLLAFASNRTGNFDVFVLDLQNNILNNLTHTPENESQPKFSADGQSIVFSRYYTEYRRDIIYLKLDGTESKRLTSGPMDAFDPMFAPNGAQVVYSVLWNARYDIYLVNLSDTVKFNVTSELPSYQNLHFDVSPILE